MITLPNDNKADLAFNGELLAQVESSPDRASSSYSGSPGRWMVLALYRTEAGTYVAHRASMTQHEGERHRYRSAPCEELADVVNFFEYGWLAKELYEAAGLATARYVA